MSSSQVVREDLPKSIKFEHYKLDLTPNFTDFTFRGKVNITYKKVNDTNKIVLNAKELKISSCQIIHDTTFKTLLLRPTSISLDEKLERVIFTFEDIIPKEAILSIEFEGILNDDMNGFYKSKYFHEGKEQYMAVTQFEPVSARRAFPCADEPALKATFQVTMNIPKDKMCLSNTSVLTEELTDNNMKRVSFLTTPVMSTYLLAFFVGNMDYVEKIDTKPISKNNLRIRVYTPPGKKSQGEFALEVASKMYEILC